jgi:hypothetical protein
MKQREYVGKYIVYENGDVYSKKLKRFLIRRLDKCGYQCVSIANKRMFLHRIVAIVYIDNPLNKRCVNHINGIKTDNNVKNLEWCTHSENNKHAYATGLKKPTPRLNNKLVIDTITNEIYNSAKELANKKSLAYSSLIHKLNGSRRNNTIYKYYKTPN